MSIASLYDEYVRSGRITGDESQQNLVVALESLGAALSAAKPPPRRTFLSAAPKKTAKPKGLYIYGAVGRGKSMLMDLFFSAVPVHLKRRIHYIDLMSEVHAAVKRFRDENEGDPIAPLAANFAKQATLLCIDEFQVTDIADAMILGRLLAELEKNGVVLVATSNRHPRSLYENGINRQLFLPAIELIEAVADVIQLDGPIDYRLARLERGRVYFSPLGADSDAALQSVWQNLTGLDRGAPSALDVNGRKLQIPEQAKGAARFSFNDLCHANLGPEDFIAIGANFHAVFVQGVPVMSPGDRNESRRFVMLIDTLYERKAKFICTAASTPENLYQMGDGAFEFERTASRLMEMQTPDYLAQVQKK